MNHPSSDVGTLSFPGDHWKLVQWGIDAAHANGVDLSPYRAVLVVQNYGVDRGAAANGVVIDGGSRNLIGSIDPTARNVIANSGNGVGNTVITRNR